MKNILVIRVSAIGDVIHTFPAIILLKKLYPKSAIHWVAQRKASALLHNQNFVDHVWELPDHYLSRKHLGTTIKTIRTLRKTKWDAIIDFQGLLKTSLVHLFLRGPKYGFSKSAARSTITTWFTHKHITPDWHNIIQKNLALASAVAYDQNKTGSNPTIQSLLPDMKLHVPQNKQETVRSWLTKNNLKNPILLAPNTTWLAKHWPTQHWQALMYKLLANNQQVVLVGTQFGAQAADLAQWAGNNNLPVSSAPAWDLLTLSHLIKISSLLIAPDTGVLHLADFIGAKSIALFGPTLALRHGPFLRLGNQQHAQQATCSHFYKKQHGTQESIDAKSNCLYTLTPDNVYNASQDYLASPQTSMVRNQNL